jgi:hypothetical protein
MRRKGGWFGGAVDGRGRTRVRHDLVEEEVAIR